MNNMSECELCPRGTYRDGSRPSCKACNLGFSTPVGGCSFPSNCSVPDCQPGTQINPNWIHRKQEGNRSMVLCIKCPYNYYQARRFYFLTVFCVLERRTYSAKML